MNRIAYLALRDGYCSALVPWWEWTERTDTQRKESPRTKLILTNLLSPQSDTLRHPYSLATTRPFSLQSSQLGSEFSMKRRRRGRKRKRGCASEDCCEYFHSLAQFPVSIYFPAFSSGTCQNLVFFSPSSAFTWRRFFNNWFLVSYFVPPAQLPNFSAPSAEHCQFQLH